MSFILRQITRRAGGGEIARQVVLAGDSVLVGRGTDCALQIPDLAVMLRHARLVQAGDRVAIEALAGVPLNVGGRFVDRATVDPRSAVVVRLGNHILTIAGGGGHDVVLTVEPAAGAFDGVEADDAGQVFGLAAVMPGRRPLAWAALLLVLGFGLAWPWWWQRGHAAAPSATAVRAAAFHPDQIWTSGPLSRAHANLSHDCGACHVAGFVAVRDDACRACHAALPDHAAAARMTRARAPPRGLIATAAARLAHAAHLAQGRCAACHKEHQGADGALRLASDFCAGCHAGLSRRLPDTALRDAGSFADDHPQFRPTLVVAPGAVPVTRRVSLDAHPTEASGLRFPHRLHLAAGGAAARMALAQDGRRLDCASCHTPDADGVRFTAVTMERNCAGCHDLAFDRDRDGVVRVLPHGRPEQVAGILADFYALQPGFAGFRDRRRPGLVAPVHAARGLDAKLAAVFAPGGACGDCHLATPPGRGHGWRVVPVSVTDHYLPKGRFPHRRHDATPCATCHAAATSDAASDVLIPGIATCRLCHGNPRATTLVPSTCQTCHGYHQPVAADDRPRRGEAVARRQVKTVPRGTEPISTG